MTAKVLVIGLDAAEATLIDRWAAEGHLPALAQLRANGSTYRLANSLETLPGAIWPEITTGISCGKKPRYYHSRQLRTGEMRLRPVSRDSVMAADNYWAVASRSGCRVAAIDQVQTLPTKGLNGMQLVNWGLHDRSFPTASEPVGLLAELHKKYEDHPVRFCDRHGQARRGYEVLLEGLLEGVERKTDMLLDLLDREEWDLFTCVYGETHCVGHQFWHFLENREGENPQPIFVDAIRSVYSRIDFGISQLIKEKGKGSTVIVYTSHGMGLAIGGPQLLPEFLVRLGMSSGGGSGLTRHVRRFQTLVSHLPRPLQPALRHLAQMHGVKNLEAATGCLLDPLESQKTRAVALRNNRCGAIRLNLQDREPNGRVRSGSEASALIAELRRELLALRHPASSEPIVKKVITASEAFGENHHPDVPDLLVVFRTDVGRIEACCSQRVGEINVPLFHPNIPRTGDHTTESRLWISGPGLPKGKTFSDANVLDIAPTILRLLNVPAPDGLDGAPLSVLA